MISRSQVVYAKEREKKKTRMDRTSQTNETVARTSSNRSRETPPLGDIKQGAELTRCRNRAGPTAAVIMWPIRTLNGILPSR